MFKKSWKTTVVLDDMIANMESNEILSPIVTGLFLITRKLNIQLSFILQIYFKVFKTKTKFYTLFFMKTSKEIELQK